MHPMSYIKNVFIILFFVCHLGLIFFQAVYTTFDGYWMYHYKEKPNIPRFLQQKKQTKWYYILSGINTGYGFYGIRASSNKYFRITLYNAENRVIESDRYLDLNSWNGISRLDGYASFLINYHVETELFIREDSISEVTDFRKKYMDKSLKWLGQMKAERLPECTSYRVEVFSITSIRVKDKDFKTLKPRLYVLEDHLYTLPKAR